MRNLPKAPEGHRWRLVKDFTFKEPKLLLEKRYWWGWRRVDSSFTAIGVWGDLDTAVTWAAGEILKNRRGKDLPKNVYGVLDPEG